MKHRKFIQLGVSYSSINCMKFEFAPADLMNSLAKSIFTSLHFPDLKPNLKLKFGYTFYFLQFLLCEVSYAENCGLCC